MKINTSRTACQRRVIECARKIIFLKGIEHLTTREIGKELKLTNGALYRHFKNKKEVISLLIDDIEDTLIATIREAADRGGSCVEKLENIFWSHISYSERVKGTSFVIINKVSGIKDRHLQQKTLNVIHRYLETIKNIIDEGMESGDFNKGINSTSASLIFFGTLQSMVTIWSLSGYKLSLKDRSVAQTLDIYRSWLAPHVNSCAGHSGLRRGVAS